MPKRKLIVKMPIVPRKITLTTGVKADPAFPNELNGADPVAKSFLC
jgi:hypothetical protein